MSPPARQQARPLASQLLQTQGFFLLLDEYGSKDSYRWYRTASAALRSVLRRAHAIIHACTATCWAQLPVDWGPSRHTLPGDAHSDPHCAPAGESWWICLVTTRALARYVSPEPVPLHPTAPAAAAPVKNWDARSVLHLSLPLPRRQMRRRMRQRRQQQHQQKLPSRRTWSSSSAPLPVTMP